MKIAPVAEVKAHFSSYLDECEEGPIIVTKNGRPAAILVNIQEYARLKETLDVLSDPALMQQIRQSEAYYRSGKKGLSFEDVFGEPLTVTRKRRRG